MLYNLKGMTTCAAMSSEGGSGMQPVLKKVFTISVQVGAAVVVGQDERVGRRQLIPILSGELAGERMHGTVLPGGVDSQIIRPDGVCEVSARYAVRLDDGTGFYVENNGIRTVPEEYVDIVKSGGFIDPELYYFCTRPVMEVYDERLGWLTKQMFICCALRTPEQVFLDYYSVDQT